MGNLGVNQTLLSNYGEYYSSDNSKWRLLGAIDKVDNIIKLCSKHPHEKIIEIGFGDGAVLNRLSDLKFGNKYWGLEISESGVSWLKSRNISNLVECRIFDGYNVPYNDNEFDIVILTHVIEHVEFPRKLIYEAMRVGKLVFIEVPLEYNLRLKNSFVFNKTGHINFYSPKSISLLVQTCNLNILEQYISNPSLEVLKFRSGFSGSIRYFLRQILLKVSPGLATKLFTYHCSLICSH